MYVLTGMLQCTRFVDWPHSSRTLTTNEGDVVCYGHTSRAAERSEQLFVRRSPHPHIAAEHTAAASRSRLATAEPPELHEPLRTGQDPRRTHPLGRGAPDREGRREGSGVDVILPGPHTQDAKAPEAHGGARGGARAPGGPRGRHTVAVGRLGARALRCGSPTGAREWRPWLAVPRAPQTPEATRRALSFHACHC